MTTNEAEMVREFIVAKNATHFSTDWLEFLEEEWDELQEAVKTNDLRGILDAICDIKYELNGLGIVMGMDVTAAYAEVHRSNMTKDRGEGDHKIRKGVNYEPPVLEPFLPHG